MTSTAFGGLNCPQFSYSKRSRSPNWGEFREAGRGSGQRAARYGRLEARPTFWARVRFGIHPQCILSPAWIVLHLSARGA